MKKAEVIQELKMKRMTQKQIDWALTTIGSRALSAALSVKPDAYYDWNFNHRERGIATSQLPHNCGIGVVFSASQMNKTLHEIKRDIAKSWLNTTYGSLLATCNGTQRNIVKKLVSCGFKIVVPWHVNRTHNSQICVLSLVFPSKK